MPYRLGLITLFFLFFLKFVYAFDPRSQENLIRDLETVNYWNQRLNDRLPVTFNHLLQGGYWNMPSARMGLEGEVGAGYSSVPPYRNYNLRLQMIDRLEISGNYRIFKGVDDPILTPLGFGDLSDKGANIKICILHPEDSDYRLPGLAIGFEDVIGTRNFKSQYIVATQVFLEQNLEVSLGIGKQRIRGVFGGITWMPFRQMCHPLLSSLSLVAEYDATPYKKKSVEKHPKGRKQRTPINAGIKYRLLDTVDISLSYVRGKAWAWSISSFYNFGETRGFLPKVDDPLPYQSPVVIEPIGPRRAEEAMALDLLYAMRRQGFELLEADLDWDPCGNKILRLTVENDTYRVECDVRTRLSHILAYLVPENVSEVIVKIETFGFPIQEYHFYTPYLREFGEGQICPFELQVLSPLCEAQNIHSCFTQRLFKQNLELWNLELFPKTSSFFGSSKGKFKYALGLNLGINGFLWDNIYYSFRLGITFLSNLGKLSGIDRLNPSQLINVHTDIIRYIGQRGVTIDQMYLQKNWALGRGWYSKIALGHFEQVYGGIAGEVLYYPLHSCFAVGVEGACVKKRKIRGIEFTDTIRKLDGFVPHYKKFTGSQYFLDLYYEWREAKLDFKVMAGKFLANDYGVRYELIRYFPSGLRVYLWYTMTNGHDKINGHTYHDKGIAFSMPLDIFYTHTARSRWGYGMSAWLRDVGVTAYTGQKLYDLIREQRNDW